MYFKKLELVYSTSPIWIQSSLFLIHFNSSLNKFKQKCRKLNSIWIIEDVCLQFRPDRGDSWKFKLGMSDIIGLPVLSEDKGVKINIEKYQY